MKIVMVFDANGNEVARIGFKNLPVGGGDALGVERRPFPKDDGEGWDFLDGKDNFEEMLVQEIARQLNEGRNEGLLADRKYTWKWVNSPDKP